MIWSDAESAQALSQWLAGTVSCRIEVLDIDALFDELRSAGCCSTSRAAG